MTEGGKEKYVFSFPDDAIKTQWLTFIQSRSLGGATNPSAMAAEQDRNQALGTAPVKPAGGAALSVYEGVGFEPQPSESASLVDLNADAWAADPAPGPVGEGGGGGQREQHHKGDLLS
jgi:hypothetical protein